MSQATRPNDRHIIWSNQNLDVDDWREDYKEFLEANELDDDPNDEQALYEWMEETNYDYLSDERVNLNVQLSQPIIVIGDIGRWNGRVMGYKDIPSGNIRDCLYYSDDGIVWVTPTDICENITFESARKLSDLGQQVGRVVPKNTILVTCIASIGKNTMLGNTGSFNQQINGLTPNENKYDPYFLLTESALWSAKMKGSAAAGTMQIVNRTEFSELKTWLPSLIEQQAIGAFFKQLDHLITLHQRKPFLMKWRTSDANRNKTNRLVL